MHHIVILINPFVLIIGVENPNVVSIFLNKPRELHTTHSWDFLGLIERNDAIPNDSIWSKSQGEDIIIGNLDTGNYWFIFIYLCF